MGDVYPELTPQVSAAATKCGCWQDGTLCPGCAANVRDALASGRKPSPAARTQSSRPSVGQDVADLARRRREKGIPANAVARACGVTVPTVRGWEAGQARPSVEQLAAYGRLVEG